MITVAIVLDSLAIGGKEKVAVILANELCKRDINVHIITTRVNGELAQELVPEVVKHSLRRKHRFSIKAFWEFISLLNRVDVDVVHSHNHTSGYFVQLAKFFSGEKWIHVAHDHQGEIENYPLYKLLDKILLRKVDYYICASEELAERANRTIEISSEKVEFLPNGVDVPPEANLSKYNKFTIIQVARLVSVKNQIFAIKVASKLKDYIKDFQWIFVGSLSKTSYVESCRALAKKLGVDDYVHFLGAQMDVYDYLQKSHVGVLTSDHEGLPISLLEYMACSLPVVTTDVGNCRQVIERCEGGTVIQKNDVSAFSNAIYSLSNGERHGIKLGRMNYQCIKENYSMAKMVDRIKSIYLRTIGITN